MKSKRPKKHIPGSRIQRWFGREVKVFWKDGYEAERGLLLDIGIGCVMFAAGNNKHELGTPQVFPLTDVKFMELVEDKQ